MMRVEISSPSSFSMPSVKNRRNSITPCGVCAYLRFTTRETVERVHADVFGNVFQHHRLDVLHAVIEKVFLTLHDRLDDFVDRLSPVFDVTQQVDRRTHLLANKTLRLVADALRQHLLILRAHAQPRTTVVGKVDHVFVVVLVKFLDVDLGTDQDRLF